MSKVRASRKDFVQDKRIKNVERRLHKIDKSIEMKWIDRSHAVSLDDAAGNYFAVLNFPATQGDDAEGDMIGNEIYCTRLWLRGIINTSTSALFTPTFRIMIFYDTKPNPSQNWFIGDLIDVSVVPSRMIAPLRHSTVGPGKRFNILMDRQVSLCPPGPLWSATSASFIGNQEKTMDLSFNIPLNRKSIFDRQLGATALATHTKNELWLVVLSDVPAATPAGQKPSLVAGTRVYFKDA